MAEYNDVLDRKFYNKDDTGGQRLKKFYSDIWNGNERGEIYLVTNSAFVASLSGLFVGGILSQDKSREDFIRKHNHLVFKGKSDAKKYFIDYTMKEFLRKGIKLGTKCGILSGAISFMAVNSLIYRKDFKITDIVIGTGLITSLTRFHMGLKALTSSFIIGSTLGLIGSSLAKLGLMTFKVDVKDWLNWQNNEYFYSQLKKSQDITKSKASLSFMTKDSKNIDKNNNFINKEI